MVSQQPGSVPPASRRKPESFIGLDDHQVLKIAETALAAAQTFRIGSPERAGCWSRFDAAMGELASRGLRHMLAKLRERDDL